MAKNYSYHQKARKLPTGRQSRCRGLTTPFKFHATATDCCVIGHLTINILPDELLLATFDFYVCGAEDKGRWVALVHVCRRWRNIVFASPHRLDLQVVCTDTTPTGEMLHIWPEFPIALRIIDLQVDDEIPDNIMAALEHNDRVYEIYIDGLELEELVTEPVMQNSFPALTHLHLESYEDDRPIVPDSFLDGSAPRLRSLYLLGFLYPALPKLLLSATGLVSFSLFNTCYLSPRMMVDCLASLTRLEKLQIDGFYLPHEDRHQLGQHSRPLTRHSDLRHFPVLATLVFDGVIEYFDHLFAYIDAPRLETLKIGFPHPPIIDLSRVLVSASLKETFDALDQAHMGVKKDVMVMFTVILSSRRRTVGGTMLISLLPPDNHESKWTFWLLKQDRRSHPTSPFLANFERHDAPRGNHVLPKLGNVQWLDLFRLFPAIETLYLSEGLATCAAPALQELAGEGVMEVLPALQNLFIGNFESSSLIKEATGEFVAARELSGHPITAQSWTEEIGE